MCHLCCDMLTVKPDLMLTFLINLQIPQQFRHDMFLAEVTYRNDFLNREP
jgi:hypothetical protein